MNNKHDSFASRYKSVIGQGCLTNSKHFDTDVYGVFPTCVVSASGVTIVDEHGDKYIDYKCGLGTNILGFDNPIITKAHEKARKVGQCPSYPTKFEADAAEALTEMFTFPERWKFLNSGSEACAAAAIIARSYTNRKLILSSGYHGWMPTFQALTPPHYGCNDDANIETFRIGRIANDVAAVIIEPDQYRPSELNAIRKECDKCGVVLVFDEIITSFRYRHYSVSGYTGCRPDLILLGKAMANGGTISAVGGHQDLMDSPYFVSGTFCGETTALAAVRAVVTTLQTHDLYQNDTLWDAGGRFKEEFNAISDAIQIDGYNTFGRFNATWEYLSLFRQQMCLAGYTLSTAWFYNNVHIEHQQEFMHAAKESIGRIERHEVKLKGKMPLKPMALIVRES